MEKTQHKDWRVLLIGNGENDHEMVRRLTSHGLDVSQAAGTEAAMQCATDNHYDLAIVRVERNNSPGHSGAVKLAQRLRIPLIVMTQEKAEQELLRARRQTPPMDVAESRRHNENTDDTPFAGYYHGQESSSTPPVNGGTGKKQPPMSAEALSLMAGGIAYDVNDLLSSISSCFSMPATEEVRGNSQQLLDGILHATDQVFALVRQLLILCRKEFPKRAVVDLNHLIEQNHTLITRLLGSSTSLSVELASKPAFIAVDAMQMENVLLSLLVNARDALPNGGSVRIATRILCLPDCTAAAGLSISAGNYVELMLSQAPRGLSRQRKRRPIDLVSSAIPWMENGAGLNSVRRLVRNAGGSILAECGTEQNTLRLYLPLSGMN